jgi:uncharacterized membrane protein
MLPLAFLPFLSFAGVFWVNVEGNNVLLLFMILAIALLFVISIFSKSMITSELYPFAILMMAIALLFHSSLISDYIASFGSDVPVEYFVFKATKNNAYWNSAPAQYWGLEFGRINAMLSVTVLPTIYSIFLNMDPVWVFKVIFSLLFCFVPLGLYQMWQKYIDKKYAFISAFLFVAQETFYTEMLGLNRQIIAELFFVLLLFVILDKRMKQFSKIICFLIFSFGLVTSHYGISVIFLLILSFTLICLLTTKKHSKNITISMVFILFVIMFSWYIFTSKSTIFDSIMEFGDHVYRQLGDFFNPTTRGPQVLRGLGIETPPTIWNAISRWFAYATEFLIVIGFVGLLTKHVKTRFETEIFIFTLFAMVFLFALILVPGLAQTMRMTRFYHVLLFFLAPLCVLGAEALINLMFKHEKKLLIFVLLVIVLVPYFLFQSGFVFEVTKSDSWSIPLSGYRMNAVRLYGQLGYVDAFIVYGAQWLLENVDVENSVFYSDVVSQYWLLTMYSMIIKNKYPLSNVTIIADGGVVYLNTLNVVKGVIPSERFSWYSSELTYIFDDLCIIYANGGSNVYLNNS